MLLHHHTIQMCVSVGICFLFVTSTIAGSAEEISAQRPDHAYEHTELGDSLVGAARDGDLDNLKKIISEVGEEQEFGNVLSFHRGKEGVSALMAACATGSQDIVNWIMHVKTSALQRSKGSADSNVPVLPAAEEPPDSRGNSPLLWAIRYGHSAVVTVLLRHGAWIDRSDAEGWTPLSTAVHEGHVDIVQALVDSGCNIEATENEGYTALMWAAEEGHEEIINILLTAGARVDAVNNRGGSALMWALFENKAEAVKLFLDAGADTNLQDESGFTALHIAAGKGLASCVSLLLEKKHNTNVNVQDGNGVSPLMGAVHRRQLGIVSQLINAGAVLDYQESVTGFTGLIRAIQAGQRDIALTLIDAGADVHIRGHEGNTALMSAAQEGDSTVITALLRRGARIDEADATNGFTALMSAAYFGHKLAVEALLDHNADCARESNDGFVALDYAVDQGHEAIARVLETSCPRIAKTPQKDPADL
eukprot:m.210636 g.210636  ORF g.210636 m.210636 type:complete len:478 (+) comp19012_c0_seq3:112-1545(+)